MKYFFRCLLTSNLKDPSDLSLESGLLSSLSTFALLRKRTAITKKFRLKLRCFSIVLNLASSVTFES